MAKTLTSASDALPRLVRALAAAKQRALYWSGNMTTTGKRFVPGRNGRKNRDLQYEMACDDIASLSALLEEATGKAVKRYDPKAIERARWAQINEALVRPNNQDHGAPRTAAAPDKA